MGCQKLLHLLNVDWREKNTAGENSVAVEHESSIAAHIRSCPHCQHGIQRLSKALSTQDVLSCDQCRARFPDFYEATRPAYPQVHMSDAEMKEVLLHLGHCLSCRAEYEVFAELAEMELVEESHG